tara:strand:+ start:434 stop:646 length:213 start_codon:yes stop_codon:yes gene_type:complete
MLTAKQKLGALESELQMTARTYEEAKNVVISCEHKIREIQGGIKAIKDLISQQEEQIPVKQIAEKKSIAK